MMQSQGFVPKSSDGSSSSGLAVHIRTTRVDGPLMSYSYISGAAVGVGGTADVMEVKVDGSLVINGRQYVADKDKKEGHGSNSKGSSGDNIAIPTEFATYPLTKNMIGKRKRIVQYILRLTDDDKNTNDGNSAQTTANTNSSHNNPPITITIHANPRTKMLYVKIDGDVHDNMGLLGKPDAGDHLWARNGTADLSNDWNAYGEEWQVKDVEPKLFQDQHRSPQHPNPCVYHQTTVTTTSRQQQEEDRKMGRHLRRRLVAEESTVTIEAATDACADFVGVKKEHCVQDVMAIGDLEVADDPAYA